MLSNKIFRYIICGGITAGVEFLVFALLHEETNLYIASVVSFAFGLATSYILNKYVVFNKRDKSGVEVAQFVVLGLVNSQVSSLMTLGLAIIVPPDVAKIMSIIFIAVWNFIIMNTIIFTKKKAKQN